MITLTRSLRRGQDGDRISKKALLTCIATNPLIIGLLLGVGYAQSGLALPLALLCAGASLDFKTMLRTSNVAALSTVAKRVVVPGLLTLGGGQLRHDAGHGRACYAGGQYYRHDHGRVVFRHGARRLLVTRLGHRLSLRGRNRWKFCVRIANML